MGKTVATANDYKLISGFEAVKSTLLEERYRDRLSKPLAYWALPSDRRLPLAFLDRTLGELLETPFDDLSATPGIGQKKIGSLVKLLMRATGDGPPAVPFGIPELAEERGLEEGVIARSFNPHLVSEALWSEWTETVREMNLADEKLGRVADSLQSMPTVIWEKPLGDYQDLTLAKIRGLRTHGEKRVRCVMQVFHKVHETVARLSAGQDLRRVLGSPRILAITDWINAQLNRSGMLTSEEVRQQLAEPILRQIEIDCGRVVHRIARHRLGVDCEPMSVRAQARSMGVTRARVYQLLDDCHKVIHVRWPGGEQLLDRLTAKLGAQLGSSTDSPELFLATRQLCFPERDDQRM